jgi:molybdopterin/thiamine biosynthesis adenylyltransferase/rhodanese-related sulfurtransferase
MKSDEDEFLRYRRQIAMPEIGAEGQARLKNARVLIVGAGGLGSLAAMSLALAGVGIIGLVDDDRVSLSNLHRQPLYETADAGSWKVEAAVGRLRRLNDRVTVVPHRERLNASNALSLIGGYQVVLDCTDNFPSRYLINDATVFLKRPDVFGSLYRFDGVVTVFEAGKGPCYRCLYPEPPAPSLIPGCDQTGMIGALPSAIGSLQALEAMKLILGIGNTLIGRLIAFDGLQGKFHEFTIGKNPSCALCSPTQTIRELREYASACNPNSTDDSIAPQELQELLARSRNVVLLDVRRNEEHVLRHIGGMVIPLDELPVRVHELPAGKEVVVYCERGERSAKAIRILKEHGYPRAKHLDKGLEGWTEVYGPIGS